MVPGWPRRYNQRMQRCGVSAEVFMLRARAIDHMIVHAGGDGWENWAAAYGLDGAGGTAGGAKVNTPVDAPLTLDLAAWCATAGPPTAHLPSIAPAPGAAAHLAAGAAAAAAAASAGTAAASSPTKAVDAGAGQPVQQTANRQDPILAGPSPLTALLTKSGQASSRADGEAADGETGQQQQQLAGPSAAASRRSSINSNMAGGASGCPSLLFDLVAVVNHHGDTQHSGHYTAAHRHDSPCTAAPASVAADSADQKCAGRHVSWVLADDSRLSLVAVGGASSNACNGTVADPAQAAAAAARADAAAVLPAVVTPDAYMLVYRRRDTHALASGGKASSQQAQLQPA